MTSVSAQLECSAGLQAGDDRVRLSGIPGKDIPEAHSGAPGMDNPQASRHNAKPGRQKRPRRIPREMKSAHDVSVHPVDEFVDDSGHAEIALDLDTLVRFGIRRIRIKRRLTMDQMGELLGIHKPAVCRIESGKRHPIGWGRTPRSVAVLLGVEVSELLRICGRCGCRPPDGYQCHWRGMSAESRQTAWLRN
jgi:DNA-binding XRE family transcriptional regulator